LGKSKVKSKRLKNNLILQTQFDTLTASPDGNQNKTFDLQGSIEVLIFARRLVDTTWRRKS